MLILREDNFLSENGSPTAGWANTRDFAIADGGDWYWLGTNDQLWRYTRANDWGSKPIATGVASFTWNGLLIITYRNEQYSMSRIARRALQKQSTFTPSNGLTWSEQLIYDEIREHGIEVRRPFVANGILWLIGNASTDLIFLMNAGERRVRVNWNGYAFPKTYSVATGTVGFFGMQGNDVLNTDSSLQGIRILRLVGLATTGSTAIAKMMFFTESQDATICLVEAVMINSTVD